MLVQAKDVAYLDMTFNSDIQEFILNTTAVSFLCFGNTEVL